MTAHVATMAGEALLDLDWQALPLSPGEAPECLFTVDVEDWYHANFRSAPLPSGEGLPRRVEEGVDALLQSLSDADATATFFVLGCVAADHPDLARRIGEAGHEIGCHGMQHTLAYEQTYDELRASAGDARKLLSDQTGQPVLGFRAPSWSITRRNLWAFDVLAECGYRYDSSVFPASNYLYGIDGAPCDPYRVRAGGGEIVEVPPSVVRVGPLRVGVGGGFYLRVFPLAFHRRAMRAFGRRGAPFLGYVHPREFDPEAWRLRLPLSWLEGQIHRFGISRVRGHVESLLGSTRWGSIAQMLDRRGWLAAAD